MTTLEKIVFELFMIGAKLGLAIGFGLCFLLIFQLFSL